MLLLAAAAGCGGSPYPLVDETWRDRAAAPGAAWTRDAGRGVEVPPLFAGGRWIVAPAGRSLVALDPDDGTERWSSKLGAEIAGPPAVIGEFVVAALEGPRYEVVALRGADGGKAWRHEGVGPGLGAAGSVVVAVSLAGIAARLDPGDGDVIWRASVRASADVPPVVSEADSIVCFFVRPDSVVALDAGTGARRWGCVAGPHARMTPTPAGVLTVAEDGTVRLLDPRDGRTEATGSLDGVPADAAVRFDGGVAVATAGGELVALALPGLERAWSIRLAPPLRAAPAPVADGLAQPAAGGRVVLLDALTGEPRDTLSLPEAILTRVASSDGALLVAGGAGTVVLHRIEGRP